MPDVVLDTNVIVSAVISDKGAPRRALDAWAAGHFSLVMAPALIAEVGRALRYDRIRRRYRLSDEDIRVTLALLWTQARLIPDPSAVEALTGDAGDDLVLACCRDGKADFLVTGDRKVLELGSYESTRVVSVTEFLALLPRQPGR